VKLIDLDNLVLIGPGSEWFWTAVSAIVVSITFVAIYRQVRMQRSSAAIAQLEAILREWDAEVMQRAWLAVLVEIEAGTDPHTFPAHAVIRLANFWERIGYLTRMNHFDRKLVHRSVSDEVERAWERLRPNVVAWRADDGNQLLYGDFEWLARSMTQMSARMGMSTPLDAESMKAANRRLIEDLRVSLTAEEAQRTVPVRIVEFTRASS
jgi:hypothetical protein